MNYRQVLENIEFTFDKLRLFPRIVLIGYGYFTYMSVAWFTTIENPSMPQATFISFVVAAIPAMLTFYLNVTGKNSQIQNIQPQGGMRHRGYGVNYGGAYAQVGQTNSAPKKITRRNHPKFAGT